MGEAAEYHLHALLMSENGEFRRGWRGEVLGSKAKGYFSTEEAKRRLWDHTLEATSVG